jgi:hypothetical protein
LEYKFWQLVLSLQQDETCGRKKKSMYKEAPAFGRTGMSRNRFDQIWSSLTFSKQKEKNIYDDMGGALLDDH